MKSKKFWRGQGNNGRDVEATKIQIDLSDRYSLRLHFNHPLRHRRLLGFRRPTSHPLQRFFSSSHQRMAHHRRRFDAYSPGFFISFQISLSFFLFLHLRISSNAWCAVHNIWVCFYALVFRLGESDWNA